MRILFDTSIFIAHKPVKLPHNFLMSAVVIQELAAGAADKEALKRFNAARVEYERLGKLLVPNAEDWWIAGEGTEFIFPRHEITVERANTANVQVRTTAHSSRCLDCAHRQAS